MRVQRNLAPLLPAVGRTFAPLRRGLCAPALPAGVLTTHYKKISRANDPRWEGIDMEGADADWRASRISWFVDLSTRASGALPRKSYARRLTDRLSRRVTDRLSRNISGMTRMSSRVTSRVSRASRVSRISRIGVPPTARARASQA